MHVYKQALYISITIGDRPIFSAAEAKGCVSADRSLVRPSSGEWVEMCSVKANGAFESSYLRSTITFGALQNAENFLIPELGMNVFGFQKREESLLYAGQPICQECDCHRSPVRNASKHAVNTCLSTVRLR